MALNTLGNYTPINVVSNSTSSNTNITPSSGGVSSNNALSKYTPIGRVSSSTASNITSNGDISIPDITVNNQTAVKDQLDYTDSQDSFLNKILDLLTPDSSELYDRVAKYENETSYNLDTFIGQFHTNRVSSRISLSANRAWSNYLDDPTDENRYYAEKLDALTRTYQANNQTALDEENVIAKWVTKDIAQYLPQLGGQLETTVVPAIAGVGIGAGVGALTAGIGGAAVGAKAGIKAAMVGGSGVYSYQTMRGAAFSNMLNYASENGYNISEEEARDAAQDEAFVSSLIESGDTAVDVIMMVPGLGKLADKAGSLIASEAFKTAAKYGWNIIQEGQEESFQELMSIANERRIAKGTVSGGVESLLAEFTQLCQEYFEGKQTAEISERISEAAEGGMILGAVGGLKLGGQHLYNNTILSNITADKIADTEKYTTSTLEGMKAALSTNGGYSATVKDSDKKIAIIDNEIARREAELDSYVSVHEEAKEQIKANTNDIVNLANQDEKASEVTSKEAQKIIEDEAAYQEDTARRIIEDEKMARQIAEEEQRKKLAAEMGEEEANKQYAFDTFFDELEKAFSKPFRKLVKDTDYEKQYNLATPEERKNMAAPEYEDRYLQTAFTKKFDSFLSRLKIFINKDGKNVHLTSKDVYDMLVQYKTDKSKLSSQEKDALREVINQWVNIATKLAGDIRKSKNHINDIFKLSDLEYDDFAKSISEKIVSEDGTESYKFSRDDLINLFMSSDGIYEFRGSEENKISRRQAIKSEFARREAVSDSDTYASDEVSRLEALINNNSFIKENVNNRELNRARYEMDSYNSDPVAWHEEKVNTFTEWRTKNKLEEVNTVLKKYGLPTVNDVSLSDSEKESIQNEVTKLLEYFKDVIDTHAEASKISHEEFLENQRKAADNDAVKELRKFITELFGLKEFRWRNVLGDIDIYNSLKDNAKFVNKKGNLTELGKEIFEKRKEYLIETNGKSSAKYESTFHSVAEIETAALQFVVYVQGATDEFLSESKKAAKNKNYDSIFIQKTKLLDNYEDKPYKQSNETYGYNYNGNVPRADAGELYGSVEFEYKKTNKIYIVTDKSTEKKFVVIDKIVNGANELSRYGLLGNNGYWHAKSGYKVELASSINDVDAAIEYIINESDDIVMNDITSLLTFHNPYRYMQVGDESGKTYSENQINKKKVEDEAEERTARNRGLEYEKPEYVKSPNEYLDVSKQIVKLCLDDAKYNKKWSNRKYKALAKHTNISRQKTALVKNLFSNVTDRTGKVNYALRKAILRDLSAMQWELFEYKDGKYAIRNRKALDMFNAINDAFRFLGSDALVKGKTYENGNEKYSGNDSFDYEEVKVYTDDFLRRKATDESLKPTDDDYKVEYQPVIKLGYLSNEIEMQDGSKQTLREWLNRHSISDKFVLEMKFGEDAYILKSQLLNGTGSFVEYSLSERRNIAEIIYGREFLDSKNKKGVLVEKGEEYSEEESYLDFSPTQYQLENFAEYALKGTTAEDMNSALKFLMSDAKDENFMEGEKEFREAVKKSGKELNEEAVSSLDVIADNLVEFMVDSMDEKINDIVAEFRINSDRKERLNETLETYLDERGITTILKLCGKIRGAKGDIAEIVQDRKSLSEASFDRGIQRRSNRKEMKDSSLERRGFSYATGEEDISSDKIKGVVGRINRNTKKIERNGRIIGKYDDKTHTITFNDGKRKKYSIRQESKKEEYSSYDALDIKNMLAPEAKYMKWQLRDDIKHYRNLLNRVFDYITEHTGIIEINGKVYNNPDDIFNDVMEYTNELNKTIARDKELDKQRKLLAASINSSKKKIKTQDAYAFYRQGKISDELLLDYMYSQLSDVYSPATINRLAKVSDIFSNKDSNTQNLIIKLDHLRKVKDEIINVLSTSRDVTIDDLIEIEKDVATEYKLIKSEDTLDKLSYGIIEARYNEHEAEIEHEIQFRKNQRFTRAMKFIMFTSRLNSALNNDEDIKDVIGNLNDLVNRKNPDMPQGQALSHVIAEEDGSQDYVVLDLEANGLDYDSEVFQIGAVRISNGEKVGEFNKLIRINGNLSNDVMALTGRTNDEVHSPELPTIEEVLKEFDEFVGGRIVVGHNFESYDGRLLQRDYRTHLGKNFSNNYVDTLQIARMLRPAESNRQETLANMLGLGNESHDAFDDASQLVDIYKYLEDKAITTYGSKKEYSRKFYSDTMDYELWVKQLRASNEKALDYTVYAYNLYFKDGKFKNQIDEVVNKIDGLKKEIKGFEQKLLSLDDTGLMYEIEYKDGFVKQFSVDDVPTKKSDNEVKRTATSRKLIELRQNFEKTSERLDKLTEAAIRKNKDEALRIAGFTGDETDAEYKQKEQRRLRYLQYEETDSRRELRAIDERRTANKAYYEASIAKEIIRVEKISKERDDILSDIKNKRDLITAYENNRFEVKDSAYYIYNGDIYNIAKGDTGTDYYKGDTYVNENFGKVKRKRSPNGVATDLSGSKALYASAKDAYNRMVSRPVIMLDKNSGNEVEGYKWTIALEYHPEIYKDKEGKILVYVDGQWYEDEGQSWEKLLKEGIIPKDWKNMHLIKEDGTLSDAKFQVIDDIVYDEKEKEFKATKRKVYAKDIFASEVKKANEKTEEVVPVETAVEEIVGDDVVNETVEEEVAKEPPFVKEYNFEDDDVSPNAFVSRITSSVLKDEFSGDKHKGYSGYTLFAVDVGNGKKMFSLKDKTNTVVTSSNSWNPNEDISKSKDFRKAVVQIANKLSKYIAEDKNYKNRYTYHTIDIKSKTSTFGNVIGDDNVHSIEKLASGFGNGTFSGYLHEAKAYAEKGTESLDGLEKYCNYINKVNKKSQDIIYTSTVSGIASEILTDIEKLRNAISDYNSMRKNKDIGDNDRRNALDITYGHIGEYQIQLAKRAIDLYSAVNKREEWLEKCNNKKVEHLAKKTKLPAILENLSSLKWKQMRPDNALYSLGGFIDSKDNEMYELARKIDKALIEEQTLSVHTFSKLNEAMKNVPKNWLAKHYNDGTGIKLKSFSNEGTVFENHEITVQEALFLLHTIQSLSEKSIKEGISDVGLSFKEKDGTIIYIHSEDANWNDIEKQLAKKFPEGSEVRTIFNAGTNALEFLNNKTENMYFEVNGIHPFMSSPAAMPITFINRSGNYAFNDRATDKNSHPNSILDYYKPYRGDYDRSNRYIRLWDYKSSLRNRLSEGIQYASWGKVAAEFDIRNRTLTTEEGEGSGYRSLADIAKDKLGNAASNWFENYGKHMLAYSDTTTQFDAFLNAILSAQQGAWLTGNPGVILKQFTNYFSALDKIDFDSLVKGFFYKMSPKTKKKITEVKNSKSMTVSALLAHRHQNNEMSDFSTTFGTGLAARIHDSAPMQFLQSLIGKMDEVTEEKHLAAAYIQAAKELGSDSDKLDARAEEIYSQVILKNSPLYISRTRSEYARNTRSREGRSINTSAFERAMGMFRTALDQFWNNEYKAKMEYKTAKENGLSSTKEKKKTLNKVLLGNSMAAINYAIITVAYSWLKAKGKYKDDDDETDWDKIMSEVLYNYMMALANNTFMLGDVAELGMKIGGKFIGIDFGDYYSNESSPLSEVYNSMDNIWSYASSPSPTTLKNMVNSIMTIYPGISLNNAYSIVNMIMIDFANLTGQNPDKYTDILKKYQGETPSSSKSMSENANILIKAYTRDEIGKQLSAYAYLENSDGDYEAAIKNKIKDYYMNNSLDDSSARELLNKYYNGYKDESRKAQSINELLYTWKLEREYGVSYDEADDLLRTGILSHDDFVKIKVGYGIDESEAEEEADLCDFERAYPEYEGLVTKSFVRNWNDYYSQWGISVEVAYAFWEAVNGEETASDLNEYGHSLSNHQDKVIEYINNLPLSAEQKTNLFYNLYSNSKTNSKKMIW